MWLRSCRLRARPDVAVVSWKRRDPIAPWLATPTVRFFASATPEFDEEEDDE